MAQPDLSPLERDDRDRSPMSEAGDLLFKGVEALASLKLTVVLFAFSIALILFGTLAQTRLDIWAVLGQYFRVWFAKVELQIFFPASFFDGRPPTVSGWFPFPGGKMIGLLLFVNLLSAHAVRFKIQSSGARLWAGLGAIVLGVIATWAVIASGSNPDGFQSEAWIKWDLLWTLLKFGLGVAWVAMASSLLKIDSKRRFERGTIIALTLLLGAGLVYLFYKGDDAKLDDSSMRILWQLVKAEFAALLLLGGCALVFRKRAGVVLLHAGVGLLMFNELLVATKHKEAQMPIIEGETVSYVHDNRTSELAIVDHSDAQRDKVIVVSAGRLLRAYDSGTVIDDERLPFRLKIVDYMKNSSVRDGADPDSPVTRGAGRGNTATEIAPGSGTDSDSKFDVPSAYVKVIDRTTDRSRGVYLFSQHISREQTVEAGGKTYGVSLRPERIYKPYSLRLIDARGDTYLGTEKARNYSSELELVDESRGIKRTVKIWMNNPLRYAGETFYQSSYGRIPGTGKEFTVLQVVTNTGWMIPYVACMIVATGMLAHFWIVLLRFLNRRAAATAGVSQASEITQFEPDDKPQSGKKGHAAHVDEPALGSALPGWLQPGRAAIWFPLAICGIVAVLLCWWLMRATRRSTDGEMNVRAFGELPVVYHGRVKPMDSLARNTLRVISSKQTFRDQDNQRRPAIVWMLDTITDPEKADKYRVYRADNLDVLSALQQSPRDGFRYSYSELTSGKREAALKEQVRQASAQDPKLRTTYQRKVLDLYSHMSTAGAVRHAHRIPPREVTESGAALLESVVHYQHRMAQVPLACPMPGSKRPWQALTVPATRLWIRRFAKARNLDSLDAVFRALLLHVEDRDVRRRIEEQIFAMKVIEFRMRMQQRGLSVSDEELEDAARDYVRRLKGFEYKIEAARVIRTRLRNAMDGQSLSDPDPPQVAMLVDILAAYRDGDAKSFNDGVVKYKEWLAEYAPEGQKASDEYHPARLQFESVFNRVEPYLVAWFVYLLAFILAVTAWLGWSKPLNRAAFGLIGIAFVMHTAALIARMYISGRWGVMVTNLYSSALFIGWGCCLLGIILESVYHLGIGNAIASVAGFGTLWIAHILSFDGDTIAVMQAVLDTNFWLATHVTTVTLGYASTYAAGLLGLAYIILGLCTPYLGREKLPPALKAVALVSLGVPGALAMSRSANLGKTLARMIYGILCFAIFFSFVGTVLGGLWADDSWGRFWGWDPKENGALIIVIWNALVLHARWGGMVKDRGMAVLAVAGNVVTSWSWFGVNLLGVGLHAYGFKEGVGLALILFAASQFAFIGAGCLPKDLWWSFRSREANA